MNYLTYMLEYTIIALRKTRYIEMTDVGVIYFSIIYNI